MHVVVVDPSRTVLKAVSRLLARDSHDVTTFTDGPDALAYIKANPKVCALITSAELPTMSGVELCWETRLLSGHDRAIYIILMSSNAGQRHLISALDSGADEFIGKPPAEDELYARLRSAERLVRMQHELIRLAKVDPLTGLFNRRAFFEQGQQAIARATAAHRPVAIMFDVDHFKQINDTYGHDVGDQVLRRLAREAADDSMIVGRLGGEEFAILQEGSSLAVGIEFAEGLRARIASLAIDTTHGPLKLTSSFGVSEWAVGESIDQCLKRADGALYEAKGNGRDRVAGAPPPAATGDVLGGSGMVRTSLRGPSDIGATGLYAALPTASAPRPALPATAHVLADEPQVGALVCKVLGACGIAPKQFTAPEPLMTGLEEEPPDLIVIDLSIGQADATEILRHLEILKYQGKVLLVSGSDEGCVIEIMQIGERHGVFMLPPLNKPFRPADLQHRLAVAQSGAQSQAAASAAPSRVSPVAALQN